MLVAGAQPAQVTGSGPFDLGAFVGSERVRGHRGHRVPAGEDGVRPSEVEVVEGAGQRVTQLGGEAVLVAGGVLGQGGTDRRAMSDQNQALADLARAVSDALQKFAVAMEESSALVGDLALDEHIELPAGRGQRQTQILELDGLSSDQGMKTAEVAAAINYEIPNTYSTLQALERNGLVELLTGVTPQTWRLAPRYRNSAPVFKRIASRVQEGEWTTYGDISIAVRGDTKAARGVGRAAAAVKDFPTPRGC